jgi:hypothetical protein
LEWPSAWRTIFHGEFDAHESGGPEDPVRGQFHRAAIGGDVRDMAVVFGPASELECNARIEMMMDVDAANRRTPNLRNCGSKLERRRSSNCS